MDGYGRTLQSRRCLTILLLAVMSCYYIATRSPGLTFSPQIASELVSGLSGDALSERQEIIDHSRGDSQLIPKLDIPLDVPLDVAADELDLFEDQPEQPEKLLDGDGETFESAESVYVNDLYNRSSFDQDMVHCSVQVELDPEKHSAYPENGPCSIKVFRDYYKNNNQFFGEGVWNIINQVYPDKMRGRFYPKGCNFDQTITDDIKKLSKCFKKFKMSKILISGDSNGNRYREALEQFLLSKSDNCVLDDRGTEESGFAPATWSKYFQVPDKPSYWRMSGCPHCHAQTHTCSGFGAYKTNISVEFVGLNQIVDKRLKFSETQDPSDYFLEEPTFMELFLRDYLPHTGFPDVWFFSPPLHHESWFQNVTSFRENMTIFRRLLDHYLPPTTKIVFFTDVRECPLRRIDIVQKFYEKWNTNIERNKVFHVMGQIIFDEFRDHLLDPEGHYMAFMDAGKILCPFTCNWHDDGGHMKPFVYETFWEYIFQYLCVTE